MNYSSPTNQLVLPVGINQDASFENFFGDTNQKISVLLKETLVATPETLTYIAGPTGSGKTHLVFAAMQFFEQQGKQVCYVSMDELVDEEQGVAALFDDLEVFDLVILENIDAWLDSSFSEQALFNLFNQFKMSGQQLLLTSKEVPTGLDIKLNDLRSRLSSGLLLRLQPLSDIEKEWVLRQAAKERGLIMSEDVSAYIIKRSSRNMGQLLSVLGTLDKASLVEQRKLTVPFVKKILGW